MVNFACTGTFCSVDFDLGDALSLVASEKSMCALFNLRQSALSSILEQTVEYAAKTVEWKRLDRCVFDDTENGYF